MSARGVGLSLPIALFVIAQFRVPALGAGRLNGPIVEFSVTLLQFGWQAAGQIVVLVPFVLDLFHKALHAANIPASAIFCFRDKTK